MRRLQVTRRRADAARLDTYAHAWNRVAAAATRAGCRAWRFRAVGDGADFLEFLEWSEGDAAPVGDGELRAALDRLGEYGKILESTEWQEAI